MYTREACVHASATCTTVLLLLLLALSSALSLRQWLSALYLLLVSTCTRRHQALASVLLGALLSRGTRPVAQSSRLDCTALTHSAHRQPTLVHAKHHQKCCLMLPVLPYSSTFESGMLLSAQRLLELNSATNSIIAKSNAYVTVTVSART
jgi:hypothetical protein